MNVQRLLLSSVAGLSSALIAYSAFFTGGNLAGVMAYLRQRGAARRLEASGADAAQVQAARDRLHDLGLSIADPVYAAQMIPVALLIGLAVGLLMWWLFAGRVSGAARPDVEERMVLRLAHRLGGQFTLTQLTEISPLSADQAHVVTARMLQEGRLRRTEGGFTLA